MTTATDDMTKDPCAIDVPDSLRTPKWCSDLDVYVPGENDDWTRCIRTTGGVGVVDEPGGDTLSVSLNVNVYEHGTARPEAYGSIDILTDVGHDLPLKYATRTAAAIALLDAAFQLNAEPTSEQLDMLEASIRGQARDILAPREV